jgi:hypothetical protein
MLIESLENKVMEDVKLTHSSALAKGTPGENTMEIEVQ